MTSIKLKLSINSQARRIDYCSLEGRVLSPDNYFKIKQGLWVAEFDNFPIDADNDLDLIIVVIGNPSTSALFKMQVEINSKVLPATPLDVPLNHNGFGAFVQQISIANAANLAVNSPVLTNS